MLWEIKLKTILLNTMHTNFKLKPSLMEKKGTNFNKVHAFFKLAALGNFQKNDISLIDNFLLRHQDHFNSNLQSVPLSIWT
jgi:hypothetical protein